MVTFVPLYVEVQRSPSSPNPYLWLLLSSQEIPISLDRIIIAAAKHPTLGLYSTQKLLRWSYSRGFLCIIISSCLREGASGDL